MLNRIFGLRCPDCDNRIEEDERYCPHCGADLDVPVEQTTHNPELQINGKNPARTMQYFEEAQKTYDDEANFKDALLNCDLAIQYDPDLAEAYNLRGLILDALGRTSEALTAYQEAVRLNPKLDDAIINLRDAELEQNDLQKSINQRHITWLIMFFGVTGLFVILLSTACLYFTFMFGSKLFGPKTTLIFEPDYSLVSTVDPSDLETTAQILTERSESLGYTGISFVVSENNQIIGQIPNSIDIQNFTDRIIAIGLLEFVDFGKTSFPDGKFIATDFNYQYLSQPNGTQWHTVMTNNELETITVDKNQTGSYEINFTLTSKGTKIFLDYTTET